MYAPFEGCMRRRRRLDGGTRNDGGPRRRRAESAISRGERSYRFWPAAGQVFPTPLTALIAPGSYHPTEKRRFSPPLCFFCSLSLRAERRENDRNARGKFTDYCGPGFLLLPASTVGHAARNTWNDCPRFVSVETSNANRYDSGFLGPLESE